MKLKKNEYLIIVDKTGEVQKVISTERGTMDELLVLTTKYQKKFPKGGVYYAIREAEIEG